MQNVNFYARKSAVFGYFLRISIQCYMQKCFMGMTLYNIDH